MATQLQLRRGNTSATGAFTGAVAEVTIDTDKKTLVVHDGSTAGGIPLAKESALSANATSLISAYITANAAFDKANSANVYAQAAFDKANTGDPQGAAAYDKANSAYNQANTGTTSAQSAYDKANSSYDKANTANTYAQSAYNKANSGYDQANTATTSAQASFDLANSTTTYATSGYGKANSANVLAQAAFDFANTSNIKMDSAYAFANSINIKVDSAYAWANTINIKSDSAYAFSNTVNIKVDSAYAFANSINIKVDSAYAFANSVNIKTDSAYAFANSTNIKVDSAYAFANSVNIKLDSAYAFANNINIKTDSAYAWANTVNVSASSAYAKANAANVLAQGAYDRANTKFNSTGGTISGDTTVTGNLTVVGQTIYANTTTALIADNILTLNAAIDQATAPALNAGIEIDRGSSANVLLLWNESTDKWTFTNDGTTYYNIADASRLDSAYGHANSSYNQANTATTSAQAAFDKANSANVYAQAAFDKANTDATNISITAGVYGNATIIPVITLVANGRVSAVTNTTIQSGSTTQVGLVQLNDTITSTSTTLAGTANAVRSAANAQIKLNGTLVGEGRSINFANTSGQISTTVVVDTANNEVDVTLGLASVGTAGTYGNTTYLPVITTDSSGRVTSVTNTAISFPAEADTLATVTGRGATTSQSINISNSTASTSNATGALTVNGGAGFKGNVYADTVYSGGTQVATLADVLALSIALG